MKEEEREDGEEKKEEEKEGLFYLLIAIVDILVNIPQECFQSFHVNKRLAFYYSQP